MELYAKHDEIKQKCRSLYMKFFYGDSLSDLEYDIENDYLVKK